MILVCVVCLALLVSPSHGICDVPFRESALQFLKDHNAKSSWQWHESYTYTWNYETNLTHFNKQQLLRFNDHYADFKAAQWKKANSFNWKAFKDCDSDMYRQFKLISVLDETVLPIREYDELTHQVEMMLHAYSTARVCKRRNCQVPTVPLDPDVSILMASSTNYEEMLRVWVEYRMAIGKKAKRPFLRHMELLNKAARINGLRNAAELWLSNYETNDYPSQLEEIWSQLEPFYKQLHAYVRRRLMKIYPGKIKPDGPIPAHILGTITANNWEYVKDLVIPYPKAAEIDVTKAMIRKRITPLKMFRMAENFYLSLGLMPMTPEFWNKSIIQKPLDRHMACHASSWDFADGKDMRIKICSNVDMLDLVIIHHEMGHVQYYLQYKDLPFVYRTGANEGFHEAIGDTIALSVATPQHMRKIGLLEKLPDSDEQEINFLLDLALKKIAFMPYSYILDLWRWKMFSGQIKVSNTNTKWWELRLKYQGICPAVRRTEKDFDPPSHYHIPANISYVRYFVARILQFQFLRELCKESGYRGDLHKCDIYGSKAAGALFSKVLSKGRSVPWNEAMAIITKGRTNKMEAKGILEYFDPLIKWLEKENRGEFIGWKSNDATLCPSPAPVGRT